MKKILLFGAGKSATVLIDYFLKNAGTEGWGLTVVDANRELAAAKIGNAPAGQAASFDIRDAHLRRQHIGEADIVISLLPPSLHLLVARDCLEGRKNLLTASYMDDGIKALQKEIEDAGLLFLYEMGLDPGIDHMSAKKMIDRIKAQGGTITSFLSHCGGLVARQSDTNPWRYKISWNPRNVVLAGKAGAQFRQQGKVVEMGYESLFSEKRFVSVPQLDLLCWYPNRDSLSYGATYDIPDCPTFIRTTLRYPDFIYGWKNLIDLRLTDETLFYHTDGKTLKAFFSEHLEKVGFRDWLHNRMTVPLQHKQYELNDRAKPAGLQQDFCGSVREPMNRSNADGDLQNGNLENLMLSAGSVAAAQKEESKLMLEQLCFLGMDDDQTFINKGYCSAADVLQVALEKKLALLPGDKDLVVMLHEIEYTQGGERFREEASLVLEGEDDHHTAMAKTVGLPLGIAARLILNGTISETGLLIPVVPSIYNPVLQELGLAGIRFHESKRRIV